MNRILVLGFVVLALGCRDSSAPQDPWLGKWQLQYVNGATLPDSLTAGGYATKVFQRTLETYTGGKGSWTDSSFTRNPSCDRPFSQPADQMCNSSGIGLVVWAVVGDTLTATRVFGSTYGYVTPVKHFVRHGIFLVRTEEGMIEVYQR